MFTLCTSWPKVAEDALTLLVILSFFGFMAFVSWLYR